MRRPRQRPEGHAKQHSEREAQHQAGGIQTAQAECCHATPPANACQQYSAPWAASKRLAQGRDRSPGTLGIGGGVVAAAAALQRGEQPGAGGPLSLLAEHQVVACRIALQHQRERPDLGVAHRGVAHQPFAGIGLEVESHAGLRRRLL